MTLDQDEMTVITGPPDDSPFTAVEDIEIDDSAEGTIIEEVDPNVVLGPQVRGTCRVCGEAASNGRAFFCDRHAAYSPSYGAAPQTRMHVEGGAPRRTRDTDKAATRASIRTLKNTILKLNPQIVMAGQYATGVPNDWLDGVVAEVVTGINSDGSPTTVKLWEPSLRTQFELTDKQAELIAESAVAFTNSPTGKNMVTMAAVIQPYVTLAAGVGVLVLHAIKLSNIKQQVVQIKGAAQQQQQQQVPAPPVSQVLYDDEGMGSVA